MIDDDEARRESEIIEARIAGKSVRAIAKARGTTVAEINRVIDRFADGVITDKVRKHSLALELERLDEVQEVFYQRALAGDVQSGALILKIIERRGVMLGLHVPQTAVLKIVDDAKPTETSTDRIERALNALITDRKEDRPARPLDAIVAFLGQAFRRWAHLSIGAEKDGEKGRRPHLYTIYWTPQSYIGPPSTIARKLGIAHRHSKFSSASFMAVPASACRERRFSRPFAQRVRNDFLHQFSGKCCVCGV